MTRSRRALLLVGVCVLALGLAAATISNPSTPGVGGGGPAHGVSGGQAGGQNASQSGGQNASSAGATGLVPQTCVPPLTTWQFRVGALLAAAAALLLVGRRYGAVRAGAFGFVFGAPALVLYVVLTRCGATASVAGMRPLAPPNFSSAPASATNATGTGGSGASSVPPIFGVLVVAVLLAVVAIVVFRGSDDTDAAMGADGDDESTGAGALGDVGRAAGEAADRLGRGDGDIGNEVYRAWREMTTHLDVANPEASTPAEFAAAAREAGMDPAHVTVLTDLFNEVRYGGQEADEARVRRAREALREIEAAYGGEE